MVREDLQMVGRISKPSGILTRQAFELFLAICLTIGGLMTFPVQSLIRRKRVSMATGAPATT
jgi:hypothetical protein